jgi:LytS/YehU family sensor histidine kinase
MEYGWAIVLVRLLEKAAVLTAVAFLISLFGPFQRLLVGSVSWRRQVALAIVFGLLALWGTHLGIGWRGLNPNTRAVGVIIAGLVGGPVVGVTIGLFAGSYTALVSGGEVRLLLVLASVMDGALASAWVYWERRRLKLAGAPPAQLLTRLSVTRAFLAAVLIQSVHLVTIAVILLIWHPSFLTREVQQYLAFVPEVFGSATGVALFLIVLRNALRQREHERQLSWQVAAAARAKLSAWQAQVRPHFLYNALTTIASLVRTDPGAARHLLGQLAAFYRATLEHGDELIPLREEIARLEPYLDIERARMGERLKVELRVGEGAGDVKVPPFLLQPLVENAIKHGLAPRARGGTVWLAVEVAEDAASAEPVLHCTVDDDGVGHTGAPFGVGLGNLRERLLSIYGDAAGVTVGPREGGGACARVWLPVKAAPSRLHLEESGVREGRPS